MNNFEKDTNLIDSINELSDEILDNPDSKKNTINESQIKFHNTLREPESDSKSKIKNKQKISQEKKHSDIQIKNYYKRNLKSGRPKPNKKVKMHKSNKPIFLTYSIIIVILAGIAFYLYYPNNNKTKNNQFFITAQNYHKNRDYKKAIIYYKKYLDDVDNNEQNVTKIKYLIAGCYYWFGDLKNSYKYFNSIVNNNIGSSYSKKSTYWLKQIQRQINNSKFK